MKQKAIIILFTCLWATSSFAQENIIQDNSSPGLWELVLKTKENDNMIVNRSVQKCLTKDYLEKNSKFNIDDIWDKNKLKCKRNSLTTKGNQTTIGFVCSPVSEKSEVIQIEINSSYSSEKTTSHLITEYKTKDKTGTKRVLNTSIQGKRLGSC